MRFVFDLEGTISFHDEKVSDYLTDMLAFLCERGHEPIFVSSKSIRHMLTLLDKQFHNSKMVGGNGAIICYRGNIEQIVAFSTSMFSKLKELIQLFDATYLVESDWDYAYTGGAYHRVVNDVDPYKLAENHHLEDLSTVWKITILSASNRKEMIEKIRKLNVAVHLIDDGEMIEITPLGLSKWNALRTLGIQKRNYIAFGKDEEDVNVFDFAQYTILIGNNPALVAFADEQLIVDDRIEMKIVESCKRLSERFKLT